MKRMRRIPVGIRGGYSPPWRENDDSTRTSTLTMLQTNGIQVLIFKAPVFDISTVFSEKKEKSFTQRTSFIDRASSATVSPRPSPVSNN